MKLAAILVLIAVPMLEIGLLIAAGQGIGFWWTLAIVIGTAMLGSSVLVRGGIAAPLRIREALLRGEMPVAAMLDGMLVAFAGFLLITPGLLADAIGLLLLVPVVRRLVARWAASLMPGVATFETAGGSGRPGRPSFDSQRPGGPPGDTGGPVIEGEFERVDERTLDPNRAKPDGDARR